MALKAEIGIVPIHQENIAFTKIYQVVYSLQEMVNVVCKSI